jgi:hypothetical protein
MSRTLKDRPYWVIKNAPDTAKYPIHHHVVTKSEVVGTEEVTRPGIDLKTGHWITVHWYDRPLYKSWRENVDCTLDVPENETTWRRRSDKNCYYNLEYYPNERRNAEFKQLTNRTLRSKIRQQLHTALIADLDWDEIDISDSPKYNKYGWWD